MSPGMTIQPSDAILATTKIRANEQFEEQCRNIAVRMDRMFAILFAVQWLAGIAAALVISPRTWIGSASAVHAHVWAAILLGGLISGVPIILVIIEAGRRSNSYIIAAAQLLTSALLIHLTGGRIETHFHVFGSLAFLSLYRNWKVLVPATIAIAADHLLRGLFWPESVFGTANAGTWRWLEHAGWVLFEDAVLVLACVQAQREMRKLALRWAETSVMNDVIDEEVQRQMAEVRRGEQRLRDNEQRLRDIVDTACDAYIAMDAKGRVVEWSRRAAELLGWSTEEAVGQSIGSLVAVEELVQAIAAWERSPERDEVSGRRLESVARTRGGQILPVEISLSQLRNSQAPVFYSFVHDITHRQQLQTQWHMPRRWSRWANLRRA